MYDTTKYQVKLPFGSLTVVDPRSATETIYKALRSAFGEFHRIQVLINRRSDTLFDIEFKKNEGYNVDNQGSEKYRVSLGDTFRTKYGHSITIDWIEKDGLIITFQRYEDERFQFSERKVKLEKIKNVSKI